MSEPSFVLDLRVLVRQGVVRMGALTRGGRVRFVDPGSRRLFGEVSFDLDTCRPDGLLLTLRYDLIREGKSVVLDVPLCFAPRGRRGAEWRFVCPLGCGREAARLHLPGGGARFGCRTCHRGLLARSAGPPPVRPPGLRVG